MSETASPVAPTELSQPPEPNVRIEVIAAMLEVMRSRHIDPRDRIDAATLLTQVTKISR